MNPSLGRDSEALDPFEWLARMSDHIPGPGQHRTLFYGEDSDRVRGSGHPGEPEALAGDEPKPRGRCPPSWARLIARVYQVDSLVYTRGQRMSLIRMRHELAEHQLKQRHLDLSRGAAIGLDVPELSSRLQYVRHEGDAEEEVEEEVEEIDAATD